MLYLNHKEDKTMTRIKLENYTEKQLELQSKFMQALALAGVDLRVKYSILSAQEIISEVKREARLFCK
jgi:Ser/Thr protein kinase RdoA (MazF antagonist)